MIYGDRVEILGGKYAGHEAMVSLPVEADKPEVRWIQIWPFSNPDVKQGRLDVVAYNLKDVKRVGNRCAVCDRSAPKDDYLCHRCRDS